VRTILLKTLIRNEGVWDIFERASVIVAQITNLDIITKKGRYIINLSKGVAKVNVYTDDFSRATMTTSFNKLNFGYDDDHIFMTLESDENLFLDEPEEIYEDYINIDLYETKSVKGEIVVINQETDRKRKITINDSLTNLRAIIEIIDVVYRRQ